MYMSPRHVSLSRRQEPHDNYEPILYSDAGNFSSSANLTPTCDEKVFDPTPLFHSDSLASSGTLSAAPPHELPYDRCAIDAHPPHFEHAGRC